MFWKNYENLCRKNGLSPNKVAKELGIASGTVSEWKNVNRKPQNSTLLKISKYFGVSADWLLTGEESISDLYMQLSEENQQIILNEIKSMLNAQNKISL